MWWPHNLSEISRLFLKEILNNFGVTMVHHLAEIIAFGVQGKHGHEEMQYIIQWYDIVREFLVIDSPMSGLLLLDHKYFYLPTFDPIPRQMKIIMIPTQKPAEWLVDNWSSWSEPHLEPVSKTPGTMTHWITLVFQGPISNIMSPSKLLDHAVNRDTLMGLVPISS